MNEKTKMLSTGDIGVSAEQRALNINFAVAVFDADGRLQRANNRYFLLFCTTLDAAIGAEEAASFAIDNQRREYDALWAGLADGRPRHSTAVRHHPGRDYFWVKAIYTPIVANGALQEVIAIYEDVTDAQLQQTDDRGQVRAINLSQAVVHFAVDGTILEANPLFLETMGYSHYELIGQHHRVLMAPGQADTEEYRTFWAGLAAGHHRSAEFKRVRRDGREVWLQASYNPVFDPAGRILKIVKYATDVTAEKMRQAEYQWQVAAIHKSHAVIVFDMHGTVLEANDTFLSALGYTAEEVAGQHHRMFVDAVYAHSIEYAQFWRRLEQGHYHAGQYRRIAKNGEAVWLQASYNPIFDTDGKPIKVVKYATIISDEKLQQADHQGQIAAIHKAQCVVSFDLDGKVLDVNDNFLNLLGYRYCDVRGRDHSLFVSAEEAGSEAYRDFWQALVAGKHQVGEFKRIGCDGREVWLQASYNPIFDMNGKPFKIVKYATNVTEDKLQQSDYRSQIEAINKSQGVIELGLDGTILDANANFLDTFGYRLDELQGRHHSMLVMPGVAETREYAELWETLRSGAYHSGLYKRASKTGEEIWLQATYNPVLDLNGRPYKVIKFATDVSANIAMAQAYDEASRMAQHDAATALPNRLKLASFMSSAMPHPSSRLAALYIDLDRFKPINDTFGHAVGDRVLGEVADRLRRCLADDQLVARVGGDEFVIAAPALVDDDIEILCQTVLAEITRPIHHHDGELQVTASIGVSVSPLDGNSPDDLLKNADTALYRSKKDGRATYSFYTEEMNEKITAYRAMTEDMRRALVSNEFVLEYQPRFDTRGQEVRSVEALVRWAHPEKGLVPPAEFIPLAERNGLIIPLGEWVLATACRMIASQHDEIGVSVNISPVQFKDDRLVDTVTRVLADTGLAPSRLELEVTEGVLLENAERARDILGEIKALGVRLAIDDFGTGYSSLSYLRSFPFDVIKIDRRFISDMEHQEGTRAIVKAILSLGRALGLSVTAEGVETDAQLEMLALDDCGEVQGFLLARPMRSNALERLLHKVTSPTSLDTAREREKPVVPDARKVLPMSLSGRRG